MCKCGCHTCDLVKPVLLKEQKFSPIISTGLTYLIKENKPLSENLFRYGSNAFLALWKEARSLYSRGIINVGPDDAILLKETHLGEFGIYEGKKVALDMPMAYELKEEKDPELNKPKRGGSKKFYVYVRDPKTKNIKKVNFGDAGNLKVKLNDPEARKAFAARHKCAQKTDKTKAGYWSCRIGRYWKSLGGEKNFSGYW
jgi:hypothetical protein